MQVILTVVAIVFLVVVVICIWKTGEYFNTLPEDNQYKSVLAWDLLVLFFVAIALIMRIVSM
jgi:heme/copper-type cytochrome/quinol oxidase subunit 2